ncbi:MAG TPA: DUF2807 domain-containing protein [Caulobacteraceae bacterium]|jgi:hypothetical protein
MIRNLFLIAGASFVLAVVCFGGAVALGGRDLADHHWVFDRHWWHGHGVHWDFDDDHDRQAVMAGPSTTREIAWNGGDSLDIDAPVDMQFTQAPGPGKLVITGPKDALDQVELSGSHLRMIDDGDLDGRLTVVMTAPAVTRFSLSGDDSLSISNYDQDQLSIDLSGSGSATAKGKARAIKLDVSGNGDIDLAGLTADSADAEISGSGRAVIAPASAADLRISGSGEIELMTHPAKLNSDVSGSGRIVEGGAASAPAPGPAPKPS